jgi:hypothetical protein
MINDTSQNYLFHQIVSCFNVHEPCPVHGSDVIETSSIDISSKKTSINNIFENNLKKQIYNFVSFILFYFSLLEICLLFLLLHEFVSLDPSHTRNILNEIV